MVSHRSGKLKIFYSVFQNIFIFSLFTYFLIPLHIYFYLYHYNVSYKFLIHFNQQLKVINKTITVTSHVESKPQLNHAFLNFHNFTFQRYLKQCQFNPLNPELNPVCYLLAILGTHHFLHVSRIRVKILTFRRLMIYIYIWSTHS